MAEVNRKESPIDVLMTHFEQSGVNMEELAKLNSCSWIYFKDFEKAEIYNSAYLDFMNAVDKTFELSENYEKTGNQISYNEAKAQVEKAIARFDEVNGLAHDSSLVYSKEELDAIRREGKLGNELDEIKGIDDAEVKVIAGEAQDQIDAVSQAKKEGLRNIDKAEAQISKAENSMNYAKYVLNFLNGISPSEKKALTELMNEDTLTADQIKQAEDIFNNLGKDSQVIKSLAAYVKEEEQTAYKEAQVEIAKHPIEFMLNSMKQAIETYNDAKDATRVSDTMFKKGINSLKNMAAAIVQAPSKAYKDLSLFTAGTAKEFVEEASRNAKEAWETMSEVANKTTSFLKSASKRLMMECDKGLEAVTLGKWSNFCQKVEKKAADFINQKYNLQTVSGNKDRFKTITEKSFSDVFGEIMKGNKAGDAISKLSDKLKGTLCAVAYAAAQAHSYATTGKGMDFITKDNEVGLSVTPGEYIKNEKGEHLQDEQGKDLSREGSAYWRDVKAMVWGEGNQSPYEVAADAFKPCKDALKAYEEKRNDAIENLDKAIKEAPATISQKLGALGASIAEGIKAFDKDVREDFQKVTKDLKTKDGEIQYGLGKIMEGVGLKVRSAFAAVQADFIDKTANLKASVLGLEAKVYGELGRLAEKHANRVSAKVEKCTEIDKQRYMDNQNLEKAIWNLTNIHPYQEKTYVSNPYLTHQKEVLMAAAPTLVNQFMIHKIDQRLNEDRRLFFKHQGYDEKTYQQARSDLNSQIKELSEKTNANLDKLEKSKTSLNRAINVLAFLNDKKDDKTAEAINVRKDAREGAALKMTVSEVMKESAKESIQDGRDAIEDALER